jgi:hypothetical protein
LSPAESTILRKDTSMVLTLPLFLIYNNNINS